MAAAGLERRRLGSSTWQMRQDPSPSDFSTDTGTGPYSRPPHHLPYKNIQRHPRLLSREILRRTADYQRLQKQPCRHLWNFALLRSCAPTELQKLLQMHAPPIQRLLGNLFNPRPSTFRTTQTFGCSATILSFPSLMSPILQHPPELSTFLSP